MKNGSNRVISRIVAFVMLVSCMFANIISTNATVNEINGTPDNVVSGSPVDTNYKWSADDLELSSSLTANPSLGGEIFGFTVHADGKSKVTSSVKTFGDGAKFERRLQAGGNSKLDTGVCAFTVNAPSAGKLYVYGVTGTNAETRYIELYDSTGNMLDSAATGPIDAGDIVPAFEFDINEAGTYLVGGTNGAINYYGMAFKAEGSAPIDPETTTEIATETTTVVIDTTSETTTNAVIGEAENFEWWLDDTAVDGTVKADTYTFGGSSIKLVKGIKGEEYTVPESASFKGLERAGKTVNAYKAGNRPADANTVATIPEAGSAAVFAPAGVGTFTFYCYAGNIVNVTTFNMAGERQGQVQTPAGCEQFSFKAEEGYQYVINTSGKTNNFGFCGFEYVLDEPVTLAVNPFTVDPLIDPAAADAVEISLKDTALGTVEATITKDTTSVTLNKNHTYELSANDGGIKPVIGGESTFKVTDESPISIELVNIPDVQLSGSFVGGEGSAVESVKFVNMVTGAEYPGTINGNAYTATLKPGEYNTVIVSSTYDTYDRVSVEEGVENTNDIYLEALLKTEYNLPEEIKANNTLLTFNGVSYNNSTSVGGNAGATITVPVSGVKKVIVAGWNSGTWDIDGQNPVTATSANKATNPATNSIVTDGTKDYVTINITDASAKTYLYWVKVVEPTATDYKAEISVPSADYPTMKDAVNAIKVMERPEGEAGRVTINLTADLFEQVVIDAPYVTLKGNGHEISWYYGINYKYYSVDSSGVYNERLFRDKYAKTETNGSYWGFATLIKGNNFIADDVTFKNSFNYSVTDKELEDGVEGINMPERTKEANVAEYSYKERSSALYIEADNIECYNCRILSSQDTLGRNGSANNNYHTYFKDCVIGGNVDYICGEFSAIFDNCELQWKTYPNDTKGNNAKIGYITAPKTSPYVFRNCKITTDTGSYEGVLGYYGRTWGAKCQAYFINCETSSTINKDGWGDMSGTDLVTALFFEQNNTSIGAPFAETPNGNVNRTTGEKYTAEELAAIIAPYADLETAKTNVLNGWTPVHYDTKSLPSYKLWGDVDGDGDVTVLDVNIVLQYTLAPEKVENIDLTVADVSGNGTIDSEDVALILQKTLDKSFEFPVEESGKFPPEKDEAPTETTTEPTTGETTTETTTEPTTAETTTEPPTTDGFSYMPSATSGKNGDGTFAKDETVYSDDNVDILSGANITYAENSGGAVNVNGREYSSFIKTIGNTENVALKVDNAEKESMYRVLFKVTAKKDTELTVDHKVGSKKTNWVLKDLDLTAGTAVSITSKYNETSSSIYETFNIALKAGETIWLAGQGTDMNVYAIDVKGETTPATAPTVYIVGDSTGCDYAETEDTSYFYKRVGFGTMLKEYFDADTTVVNLALSGRSSKSFANGINENGAEDALAKANYEKLKNEIKAGDYLIIAFGHNDEKTDVYRSTVPATTPGDYTQEGSFEKSLYDNYIKVANDAGATPILCTPTVRRQVTETFDPDTKDYTGIAWGNNDIHITANGDYPAAIKALAEKEKIALIDNLTNTKTLYESLKPGAQATAVIVTPEDGSAPYAESTTGATGAAALHAAGVEMAVDNTHLNKYGASYVASMMARDIKDNAALADLAAHVVSTEPPKAEEAHTMSLNPDWVPFDETKYVASSIWHTKGTWEGAVFGTGTAADTITEDSHPNHEINEIIPDKEVNLVAKNDKGKIQGSNDGFVMYFKQIPANTDFELTATAVVNSFNAAKGQVGFGLICRDNVFTGSAFGTSTSWAAVGCMPQSLSSVVTPLSAMARKDGKLDRTMSVLDPAPTAGTTVELKMTRANGVYTVQYGDTAPQTIEGVDTNLSNKDTDFAGVFVTRNADVTFKDINLTLK